MEVREEVREETTKELWKDVIEEVQAELVTDMREEVVVEIVAKFVGRSLRTWLFEVDPGRPLEADPKRLIASETQCVMKYLCFNDHETTRTPLVLHVSVSCQAHNRGRAKATLLPLQGRVPAMA